MAKSFIDVVQDSPRMRLGIPVKTKKPPLSNQQTALRTVSSRQRGFVGPQPRPELHKEASNARHQSSLCFPGSTNVVHEPGQACFTLDGLGSCDLKVFAEAKSSIQLDACFPLELMFSENDPRVLKGSPVRDQQSLGLFRGHFQTSAIQPTLFPPQTFIDPQLKDSDVFSGTHDKCFIREVDDVRSSRQSKCRKSLYMTFQTSGPTHDP